MKPDCPSIQDGCVNPEVCSQEGLCRYTGSPFSSERSAAQILRQAGRFVENMRKPDDSKAVAALRQILKITGATQDRPYTALSLIDGIARDGLR